MLQTERRLVKLVMDEWMAFANVRSFRFFLFELWDVLLEGLVVACRGRVLI